MSIGSAVGKQVGSAGSAAAGGSDSSFFSGELEDYSAPISGILADVSGLATSTSKYKHGSTGSLIAGGFGAAAGGAIAGPLGAKVGQMLGSTVGKLIGGAKDKKLYLRDHRNMMERTYQKLDMSYNADPYGTAGIQYAEDGGMVSGQDAGLKLVNIERGELLADPLMLNVVREYTNPNRYRPHSKNTQQEPVGNFTFIEPGKVVVPKTYADRFKKGDRLTKTSILMEIMKDQAANGTPTVPAPAAGAVPQAAAGMLVGDDPRKPKRGIGSVKPVDEGGLAPGDAGFNYLLDSMEIPAKTMYGTTTVNPIGDNPTLNPIGLSDNQLTPNGKPVLSISNNLPAGVMRPGDAGPMLDLNQIGYRKPGSKSGTSAAAAGAAGVGGGGAVTGKGKKKLNEVALAKGLNFLPTAFGLANAMQTDPYLTYNEPDYTQAEAYAQAVPTDVNISASKTAIRNKGRAVNQALNNIVSPSVRAEIAANRGAEISAEGDIIQNASNVTTQARANKLGALSNLAATKGQARYSAKGAFMEALRQDRANRQNLIHAGLSEAVTNYGAQVMDDEKINAMNSFFQYVKVKPGETVNIADSGEFSNAILALYDAAVQKGMITKTV